jgi:hypothetical protein
VPKSGSLGSVRGAGSNACPYRENAEQASKDEMRKLTCRDFRESCYCEGDERSVLAVPPGYWRQHAYKRKTGATRETPSRG